MKAWIAISLVMSLAAIILIGESIRAAETLQGSPTQNVQFSATSATFYFFDTGTGKLYAHNSASGRLMRVYALKEFGKDIVREY